jgi:predicted DNA-binding mobile mystery protein A
MHPTALARRNLDKRLGKLRQDIDAARPPSGWIKAVRKALGMTTTQFACRLGTSQSRISRLEKSEAEDAVTLATLRRAADALGCTLIYALVPNKPLEEMARDRAAKVADGQLASVNQSMALEEQALPSDTLGLERQRLIDDLQNGNPKRLWDKQ